MTWLRASIAFLFHICSGAVPGNVPKLQTVVALFWRALLRALARNVSIFPTVVACTDHRRLLTVPGHMANVPAVVALFDVWAPAHFLLTKSYVPGLLNIDKNVFN